MEKGVVRSTEGSADEDHYSVLTRLVAAVSQDHTQLRMLVYEFARRKLRRNLFQQFEEGDWSGIEERTRVLEDAIDQIETEYANKVRPLTFVADPPLTTQYSTKAVSGPSTSQKAITLSSRGTPAPVSSMSPYDDKKRTSPLGPMSDGDVFFAVARFDKRTRAKIWWKVQLSLAVVLGVVIYVAIDGQSALSFLGLRQFDPPATVSVANSSNPDAAVSPEGKPKATATLRPNTPSIPIPTEYGAYAVSQGQLVQLDLLSMRVPDQRVAISPVISTPARAHLPAGKLEFVVFRRDLVNTAPDRIMLRVVAQVARALTFDASGKAITTNIADAWVVRSNSYPMRVAPVADNPEMIIIRPDPADLVLPTGRYALVLKGIAYDFIVDGPVTDIAHCLERTDALTSPVYTECRNL
jgi:hypothetical protein